MGQPQPLQKETPCTPSRLLHTSFGHPPPIDFLTKASPSLHTIPNSCFISQPTSPFATPDYSQPIATTNSTATTSTITTSTITTTTASLKASTAVSTVVSPTSSSLTYYTNQSLASALLGEDSYPLQANPQSKHVSLPPPSDLKEPQSVSNLVSSPPQPKLLSKPGSTTHPIFSTLSPFTSHTSSKLNTCLECLKEGDTQTCIDTYTFLFNALRPHSSTSSSSSSSSSSQSSLKSSQSLSTPQKKIPTPSSETVDLDQVVTRLPEIYEFIKRDLKPSVPELVRQSSLELLGIFFHTRKLHSDIPRATIVDLLRQVVNLGLETKDKKTCFLCVWLLRMQQIPKSYFSQTLLEAISEFILYGLKNPFSSTWIPLDCITMVDIFFSYFPTFVSFASYWLLPIYQLLFSSNENIRRHAFNFFKLHLASLAPNVPTFDPFMIPYYEKKSEHIVHQLNQIIQQNEKMGIQAWSITLVVFAKSIQKSSSSVNAMLTILEKYFDVAKSNVRIYTYRAWSYLIYSFAATKTLLTERRLKLVVVPIQASFNNDKNHVFRITAAKTYATLVFSMAKLGTCVEFNQFFPMVHSLLLNILMDPNDEVKDIGCSILAALVQTKEKVDYKYGHLPNPLVNVLIPNVNPTEYISTITPNPTYILSNFSFLLKLLIAIHDQSSFGSDFICSEFNDRPLISKRIYEIYQDLLYHLNATLQKEVHLNQRGLMNLTALGDFLESLVIGPDTQAELLKLLLTPILNLPHRHLSSSRCTHPDLEETCYKKLTLSKFTFLFTEPIHISFGLRLCLIWLEAFPNISSTTYWHQVPILIQLACGETRTIQTMYTLLCFLEIQSSKFDASSLMKFWTLLGETVLQTYSTLKTPTSEFDPFVEHTDTLAYSIYCWPFCVSLTSPDLELPATLLFTYLDHLIPTSLTMLIQFFLDHFPPSLTLSTSTLATLISSVTTLLQHQFHPDLVSRCVSWIPSSLLSESILPSFLITFIETLPKLVTDPSKTTAPWFSCLKDHWKTLFSYKHLHPCLQTTWEIMCAKEPPPSPLPDIQEKNGIDVPHEQEDRLKRKGNETEEALEIHSDIQSPLKKRKFKVHTTPLNDMHQEDRLEFLRDSKPMKDMSVRELLHYQNQLHTLLLEVNATLSEKVLELDPSLRPCIPSTAPSDT